MERSPFPGMDPYLESPDHWPDFHDRFINTLCEAIADTLPKGYFARIQEDVLLLEPASLPQRIRPDVLVGTDPVSRAAGGRSTAATLEPVILENLIDLDPPVQHYIEIVRLPERDVVTVVEVLSPKNKNGSGRGIYLEKRSRILLSGEVNLVEVDLLRAGKGPRFSQALPAAHYYSLVSKADAQPQCEVYGWTVRDRLPVIPIPLRPGGPHGSANLASAFEAAYQRGRYGEIVRYADPPPPPAFSFADEEWVMSLARSRA